MKRVMVLNIVFVGFAISALAQSFNGVPDITGTARKIDYLDEIKDIPALLCPEASEKSHVLFLNVGNAMTDAEFAEAAAYIRMRYMFNIVTSNVPVNVMAGVLNDENYIMNTFGKKAVVVVAVTKEKQGPPFASIPGKCAMVNVRSLSKDKPSLSFLKKRQRQMLLKGLALACGLGASSDQYCVMYYKSFTLDGMDCTSATYGPNVYMPLLETLTALGGNEINIPLF